MKWYKHMSDMSEDPKVKRVVRKHGGIAYAVYNYVLERIAKRLETESPIPDLEESAEDIAEFLRWDTIKVEEIMLTCLHEGLFEQDEITGRVLCHKVYKFIEKSQTRSNEIRHMIDAYAGMSETVRDNPDRTEHVRTEHGRKEEKEETQQKRPNVKADTYYHTPDGIDVPMNTTRYHRLCEEYGKATTEKYIEKAYRYSLNKRGDTKQYRDYANAAETYMDKDNVQKRPKETKWPVDAGELSGVSYDGV